MSIPVQTLSPRSPEARALLAQSHAFLRTVFAPEDILALDIEGLCAPGITLYGAWQGGALAGCVALRRAEGYGEVKSFFVTPAARGQGVGRQLLAHVEAVARAEGLAVLRLETGAGLDAAQALYRAAGYVPCGPFGDYGASKVSLYFEKPL